MRFFNQEAFSRPDFPLEWHIILPSNIAIVNSCLGSSNCFELHTIWITQYGINKALLSCSPLLIFARIISGDITFPCLAFDYAKTTSPHFNWSFLVVCNRNLFLPFYQHWTGWNNTIRVFFFSSPFSSLSLSGMFTIIPHLKSFSGFLCLKYYFLTAIYTCKYAHCKAKFRILSFTICVHAIF